MSSKEHEQGPFTRVSAVGQSPGVMLYDGVTHTIRVIHTDNPKGYRH